MTKIISCPYCQAYHLLRPKTSEEMDRFQELMVDHCKEEHMDYIIWEIISQKISIYK